MPLKKKQSEKKTEPYLRDKVKSKGGLCLKFVSPGYRGTADRIVLLPGAVFFFAETKSEGKDLDPLQKAFKKKVEQLGFKFYKIDTKQQVNDLLS